MPDLTAPLPPPPERDSSQSPTRNTPARTAITNHAKRLLWRLVRLILLIYVGLLAVLYALQTRMIFPGHETQGQPSSIVRPEPGTELLHLVTASGTPIVCLLGPALDPRGQPHLNPSAQPTIIYFYGNAMCINSADAEFDRLRRLGANVLVAEYVGFGMSAGSPSEVNCHETADAAYDYLVNTRRLNPKTIFACGWSLGGAVAVGLASRHPVAGLIIFSTFTSAVDLAGRLLPFVPVSLLLRHRFDSLNKIASLRTPILIGHGRGDSIVPFDMAEKLAAAARNAGNTVETLWIDDADHNDFYDTGGPRIDAAIRQFLLKHREP